MCIDTHRNTTGVGVLDDHTGRCIQGLDALPGRIGIGNIVVREFLALQLTVVSQRTFNRSYITIERCRLMRVLAVAHVLQFDELQVECGGIRRAR